jgi:hypothetical protein
MNRTKSHFLRRNALFILYILRIPSSCQSLLSLAQDRISA